MKNMIGLAAAAALLTLSPNTASAWKNFKFGVGFNFEYSSGNNHFHRIWHNGQVPPPPHGFHMPPPMIHGHAYAPAVEHHHVQANIPAPAGNASGAQTATTPGSPYHYSSYHHSGYYYNQEPGYYYGQNVWYGW